MSCEYFPLPRRRCCNPDQAGTLARLWEMLESSVLTIEQPNDDSDSSYDGVLARHFHDSLWLLRSDNIHWIELDHELWELKQLKGSRFKVAEMQHA